ncbi:MAG: hypothetical protein R3277_08760 [Brumimicrobium sp.]|nr:hypothetical protein [Brumimicrobium sp.]
MNKEIKLLLLFFFLFTGKSFGQNSATPADSIDFSKLGKELYGTYQVQVIDSRNLPSIKADVLLIIQNKRDENNIIYHDISENIRIKILPKSEINDADFKPIDHIVFISSKDL